MVTDFSLSCSPLPRFDFLPVIASLHQLSLPSPVTAENKGDSHLSRISRFVSLPGFLLRSTPFSRPQSRPSTFLSHCKSSSGTSRRLFRRWLRRDARLFFVSAETSPEVSPLKCFAPLPPSFENLLRRPVLRQETVVVSFLILALFLSSSSSAVRGQPIRHSIRARLCAATLCLERVSHSYGWFSLLVLRFC